MQHLTIGESEEATFRSFPAWFLAKTGFALALAAASAFAASVSGNTLWWIGSVLFALFALVAVLAYTGQTLIICDYDVICRQGVFSTYEKRFSLWYTEPEIQQSLMGRVFDYGTVSIRSGDKLIAIHSVAHVRALRYIIGQRRKELLQIFIEYQASRLREARNENWPSILMCMPYIDRDK